jgi:hypothetical protein
MKRVLLVVIVFFSVTGFAQLFPFYDNYKWEKNPVITAREGDDALYYYNKYMLSIEYEYDSYHDQYYKYKTEHYRVKLNTDIAIEEFNKVYISMEDVVNLKSLKARVIKPSGVVDLKPKVEEFYSDEESEQYYYFPVSGIEIGDEIEILYTLKMEPQSDGDQFYFQGEVPIYDFDFYFITPNDTWFSFLGHNGFPRPELIDTILQRHQWVSHLDTIPAFKEEYFSEYNNVTMKLDATLKGFNKASDNSYSPYDDFNTSLNYVYNTSYKGKDAKSIKALSMRLGLHPKNKVEDNIRKIENFIKMELALNNNIPFTTPMYETIATQRAGSIGAILLFMALLNENDIEFEYGFISDRYETHFSDEIESMHFLQNYIFYFPQIDAYLAPLDFSTRLGYLDQDWIPNNAYMLSMKQYPVPETTGRVKPVPSTRAEQNRDSTVITIKVHEGFDQLDIEIFRYLTGYDAGEYQTYYYLYNDAKKEEKHQEMLDVLNDYSNFKLVSILNTEPEFAYVKPLIVKGVVTELNVPLIEKAGDFYIFKLGYLFGEYVDVREIEKKKTDFVFGHPFMASTTIDITFPEGYKISVPQEILQSDDLCPHEGIVMNSVLEIDGSHVVYYLGQVYKSNRYSISEKELMVDLFTFLNSLHKMNLVVGK